MTNKKSDLKESRLLLDSKHITPTIYNIKVVEVGDYTQVYLYENKKKVTCNDNDDFNLTSLKTKEILNSFDEEKENHKEIKLSNKIEQRSIIRSKIECQRLAKANISSWKTFITLTFSDNVTSIEDANKRFRYFTDKVRRVKKDFKYLCITEFQKRGAIHYHLLTNVSINDDKLLFTQEDNPKFKHIKYWLDGFTSIEEIKDDPPKIVGYISKYMTKDIDNRLFSHRRYFSSMNLIKPSVSYLNSDTEIGQYYYKKIIQDKQLIYDNQYINVYDNTKVTFLEYLK